jgi:membrane associated rhomboid family serine protease
MQTCYRHPDRKAGVRCQRCERLICPNCMHQASVGFHCPECTKGSGQKVYNARTLRTSPVVTQILIGINVAVFIVGLGGTSGNRLVSDYGLIGSTPFAPGLGVAAGEWYRLITGGFLHANLLHIGFNMFALWNLGQLLEPALGRLRFGLVYFAALLAGSLGVMILSPDQLTVGASGAVFGLMGATLAAYRARGIDPFRSSVGTVVMLNLLITFLIPGISIGGHIGGLIGGFICGYILEEAAPKAKLPPALANGLVALIGLACFGAAIAIA